MSEQKPVAIVGIGAIMPDAPNAKLFWENILKGHYSIKDVPSDRWDTNLYYHSDPKVPDKTYSKIGSWVTNFEFNPMKMRIPIPPTVIAQMDFTQQWAIAASHQALSDYGFPERNIDPERMAVIIGNSNAGERHYRSTMRILLPEYVQALEKSETFRNLPSAVQQQLIESFQHNIHQQIPDITEDTMSGELSNIIAGRVANVFNFSGPNFVTDAACASSLAALQAAVQGLNDFQFDTVLVGGVDRNMGPESYVKFSKIGALSADGSRPYADGANGFVMGEGTAIFMLKRLMDAEREGDKIYAVIRGIGSSSDGKGKGITAPNPLGQQRAIERAWKNASVTPASAGLIEGHGTSTRVGDVVEVNSLNEIFGKFGIPVGTIALGSVKSNIGHLKSAAGAAGLAKVAFALDQKMLPPSVNFHKPNPNIDFEHMPFFVNTQAQAWEKPVGEIRRAAVSAFGFGGANFHVVMEEYVPGLHGERQPTYSIPAVTANPVDRVVSSAPIVSNSTKLVENQAVKEFVLAAVSEKTGYPAEMLDVELDLEADLGVDTVKQAELFLTIREHFGIPRREDLRLSDYNTLEKVIGFVMDNASGSDSSPSNAISQNETNHQTGASVLTSPTEVAINTTAKASDQEITQFVIQQVAEKTGYPAEILDLELDLEADLGVDTVKQAELFAAIRGHYGVPRREDLRLSDYNTLAKVINFFRENVGDQTMSSPPAVAISQPSSSALAQAEHFRGLHFLSANTIAELKVKLQNSLSQAQQGTLPPSQLPEPDQLTLSERLVIDYGNQEEFIKRAEKALKAFDSDNPSMWQAMTAQGVYRGSGDPGKVAFLFPGQGSQYVNMLRELRAIEPVVDAVFVEADRVMEPLLGKPLTHFIYAEGDEASLKEAEQKLKDTTITQPAVLTANVALLRLLEKYGFKPDMVIGHSLGEYAALVAAGVLRFDEALEVVSARGREMVKVAMEDNGCMAAVSAPLKEVERILGTIDEYVVLANINSPLQSVIAGSTKGVDLAIQAFMAANFQAVKIPVSHAFHTKIVAPASQPLRKVIDRMDLQAPKVPVAANVTGDWYPSEREQILNLLADQVASPVQFIKGAHKLYDNGARIFVEVGPKRVLNALTSDIFKDNAEVTLLATNHPRKGALPSFNEALCALFAAGLPGSAEKSQLPRVDSPTNVAIPQTPTLDGRVPLTGSVVISGAGLGLPGKNGLVFAEDNIQRLLKGEVLIESFPQKTRENMLDRRVTRLVKHDAGAMMVNIDDLEGTVKLAGQRGRFDPANEFGIPEDRVDATDISTQLAIAAGIDALRDAGIPLVMNYRTTSKGTLLPDRWMLPEAMRDETGVIFGSAFPGLDRMSEEADHYYNFKNLLSQKQQLLDVIQMLNGSNGKVAETLQHKLEQLETQLQANDYHFHRHFVFRVLAMGHSQFAEHIGARGPNTSVNAACATTTHAVAIAEDWIRAGRCRRVIVVAGDDVTSGNLVNWIGTGLMASGAATTEGNVRQAALPFDRRRNGLIMGMGAAALVVEAEDAVRERGMRGICELLSSQIANSAFHGTRLDIAHVSDVMQRVITQAEQRFGINRHEIAARTVFVSHETYTPARGGSAAAEIHALRKNFGDQANKVIIANTKGFTGHTMGVGVEDVMAVKALEFGIVPPIAHYDKDFEPDPELGDLNLSKGGNYPVQYSLRLGAGFGSQIAMTLIRKITGVGERINQSQYQQWLASVSGYQQPELEVVQHNYRIKHVGAPKVKPMVSTWQFGQGPQGWASDAPITCSPQENFTPEVKTSEPIPVPQPIQASESTPLSVPQNDEVTRVVLEKVSEKTGYPVEMLDMELDLEADLGIDTVKQAELFASIRENFSIPRREDLRLSDYNTLQKVVQFVLDAQAQLKSAEQVEEKSADQPENSVAFEEYPSIRRRIPVAVLRPRINLCTPTDVVLEQGSRVIVIQDSGKVAPALEKKLIERQVDVLSIKNSNQEDLISQINQYAESGSIDGLYFLPTLNTETLLTKMDYEKWHNTLESKFYNLVTAIRQLPEIKFLVVATRMDGLHGLSGNGADNPLSGAAAGFAKAIARERNNIFVKVVDFTNKEKPVNLAKKLVEETLFDPAVMEVGWEEDQRFTLVLQDTEIETDQTNPIPQGAVFLVSGGTGGITAPILEDLALNTRGNFYLLARTQLPGKDHPELALLANDPEQLKFTILQRLSKSGQKATPAIINQEIAALERAAATLKTIDAIQKSGGQATYLPCNVIDPNAVNAAVKQIIEKEGQVDVLIHAAGVEKSRKLDSKSEEEFRGINNVKATGFFNLFKALENEKQLPKAIVNFGSVAGRFGNTGQTDYSAANDLLSRLTSAFRHQYPEIQVVTIDWGAWAEVGMASRGHIPELMKRAGIDMIHPQQAAGCVRQELEAGTHGEVVLAGSLGLLEMQKSPNGGLDIEKANIALTSGQPIHVMLSRTSGVSLQDGILLEAELDPSQEAFLKDHSLNGTPLLPGVMGIEGFSIAAQHIASRIGSSKSGFRVERLSNIQFMTPFKFYRDEARHITWKAQVVREEAGLVAYVTLESDLARAHQRTDHLLHFSGQVYLVPANLPQIKTEGKAPHWNGAYTLEAKDIYKLYFHGPAFQVLEGVQRNGNMVLGKLNRLIPPLSQQEKSMISVPILVELCLQTAGVWDIGKAGTLSLPKSIGALRLYENKVNGLPIYAEVQPVTSSEGEQYFDARVVDSKGQIYLEIEKYCTSPMSYNVEQELLTPVKALMK